MVKYAHYSWEIKDIVPHKEALMFFRFRAWQLVLLALATLVLTSVIFGVWGFVSVWLGLGLTALVAYFATGGQPGNATQTFKSEMALSSIIALVISGLFGFGVIFSTILDPELRRA